MSISQLKYRSQAIITRHFDVLLIYAGVLIFFGSCTGLRKISDGEYLLTKNDLTILDKSLVSNYKEVKESLGGEFDSKPNKRFLWMRPRLSIYNSVKELEKEKGFKHWLKYKVGKKPILLDEEICKNLSLTFENRLFHIGHFNARSKYEIKRKNKTAQVEYIIDAHKPYIIDTLILPDSNDSLSIAIRENFNYSLLKNDQVYSLDLLKSIRKNIDNALKDLGYYFFDQNYLLFLADTIENSKRIRLKMICKHDMPSEAANVYTFNRIVVAEDFKLDSYNPDTTEYGDYTILSSTNFMRPRVYLNSVLAENGKPYSRTKHSNSISQLMGLRAYRYVNARYIAVQGKKNKLDVLYHMTPSKRMSLSAEVNAVSKSNNFAGPGLILSFKSKNVMRGAELFSLNLKGRFEQQVGGEKEGDTAYEIGAEASLDLPRLFPFKYRRLNKPYLPKSTVNLGGGIYSRVSLYRFNTMTTGLEYTWRRNDFLTHIVKPIDISLTDLANATDEFKKFLFLNPSIRQSFEEQFIIGMSYNFIINKLGEGNKSQYYINAGADPSGNLVALIDGLTSGSDQSDEQIKILGTPISQYFRFRTDLRYYFRTGKESRLATRFYAGVGIPYGNSQVMPYVKQFFAGGTNSLRAFRARSVGPGSYIPPDSLQNVLVDQTGDIKLEANLEYRFPIVGFLKGALFTDIGNIWLVNEDSLRPGGQFELERFYKELAVGLGFGFRIDVDLVVIRFDLAFPVRKPWLPENERWVLEEIDLFNRRWRNDNLLWNISIGYPF